MTEKEQAVRLANIVLDKSYIDPDGDIMLLARQFLRAREEIDAMRKVLKACSDFMEADLLKERPNLTWQQNTVALIESARAVLDSFTVPGDAKKAAPQ